MKFTGFVKIVKNDRGTQYLVAGRLKNYIPYVYLFPLPFTALSAFALASLSAFFTAFYFEKALTAFAAAFGLEKALAAFTALSAFGLEKALPALVRTLESLLEGPELFTRMKLETA